MKARKQSKSFILSKHSLSYLEKARKEMHAESMSAALDELIADHEQQRKKKKIAAAITSYYDSLSDEEVKEQNLWGEFAEKEFPCSKSIS